MNLVASSGTNIVVSHSLRCVVVALFWVLNCCVACQLCNAQPENRSGNPIFPGWYADPEAVILQNQYWVFPTYSAPYDEQTFFDSFSSTDLTHWKKHSRILELQNIKWAKRALWAPSVLFHRDRFFLFFGANDIQNNDQLGGIGVAVSDSPSGPFLDYLGKPLIDRFHNGAQPIDQFAFKDRDGKLYLIYGGWRHCNITMLSDDLSELIPFADGTTYKEITPSGYVEGPVIFIRNEKYYFMWSEGGWTGPDYSVAYAISDSPLGPFNRIAKVLKQDPEIATGAGHHSIVKHPTTDEYFIFYHRRPLGQNDGNARVTCVEKMEFDSDGLIRPIRITHEGVNATPLP